MILDNDDNKMMTKLVLKKTMLDECDKKLKLRRKRLTKTEVYWEKARVYGKVMGRFLRLNKEIKTFGSCLVVNPVPSREGKKTIEKFSWVFHPKHKFKLLWNFFLMILLFYTATVLPYRICFDLMQDQDWTVTDLCVDIVFFVDILINFNTALCSLSGKISYNRIEIAKKYIKTWFFVDFLSCIPLDYILTNQKDTAIYNRFLRILRVTRIYKIVKILRLLKLFRLTRSDFLNYFLQSNKFNSALTRILFFVLGLILFVHISACIWFYISITDDSSQLTWIYKFRINDMDDFDVYIASIYFVFTTFTTVGYGDITPVSNSEKLFTIFLMAFGVWIYSYMISSLSSSIKSNDQAISILKAKTQCIKEFAKAIKLPPKVTIKIKNHLKMNLYKTYTNNTYFGKILKDLPSNLREEIMDHNNLGIVKGIHFFANRPSRFVNSFVKNMQLCFFVNKDVIYEEDDTSEEVYFIKEGRVLLRVEQDIVFRVYFPGSYFGEIEILEDTYRTSTAIVCSNTAQIYKITKEEFISILSNYKSIYETVKSLAKSRKFKHEEAISEAIQARLRKSDSIITDSLLDSNSEEDLSKKMLVRNDTALIISFKNDTPYKKKNRLIWERAILGKSCEVKSRVRHKSYIEKHLNGFKSCRDIKRQASLKEKISDRKKDFYIPKGKIKSKVKKLDISDEETNLDSIGIESSQTPEYFEHLASGFENTLIGIKKRRDLIEEKVTLI